jgi:GNAT superfamily N-acetyltransferase
MSRWPDPAGDPVPVAGHSVRRATLADEAAIQALFEQDPAYFTLTEGAPPRPTEAREALTADLPPGKTIDDKHVYVVHAADGGLAGVVELLAAHPDPVTWYLGLIYLAPSARGHGLGSALVHGVIANVAARGAARLRLAVVVANHGARRLYDRLGFRPIDRRPRTTWTGAVIDVDVLERPVLAT